MFWIGDSKYTIMSNIPLFIYGAALAWFSLTPFEDYGVEIWDKLMHFLAYGLYVVLAAIAADNLKRLAQLTCGIIIYGALLEILQSWVAGRSMSALDGIANSLGALCAMLILAWWRHRKDAAVG